MGFLKKILPAAATAVGAYYGGPQGAAIGNQIGTAIAGGGGKGAANKATAEQLAAIQAAQDRINQGSDASQGFLQPYQQVGEQGLDQSGFLTDPQAQFDFLQNNPLFQMGLDNANEQTSKFAASRGRLSAGDTLQQLNQNALLTAAPLIRDQKLSIQDLLTRGQNTAFGQVNVEQNAAQQISDLLTGGGATKAAGTIAGQNAKTANAGNLFDIAQMIAGNQQVQDYFSGTSGSESSIKQPAGLARVSR